MYECTYVFLVKYNIVCTTLNSSTIYRIRKFRLENTSGNVCMFVCMYSIYICITASTSICMCIYCLCMYMYGICVVCVWYMCHLQRRYLGLGNHFLVLDDTVNESIGERLVGGHVEVAVRVHSQLVNGLLAERRHVCIQHLFRV